MTLPASGPISLAMLAAEFGGSAPHSLSEYYRGGSLVPDIAENAAVPMSGAISLSNFYGARYFEGGVVSLPPTIVINMNTWVVGNRARISFVGSGDSSYFESDSVDPPGSTLFRGNWCSLPNAGSGYALQWAPISGTANFSTASLLSSGWASMTPTLYIQTPGANNDTQTIVGTVSIRRVTDLVVLASSTVTISMTHTPP